MKYMLSLNVGNGSGGNQTQQAQHQADFKESLRQLLDHPELAQLDDATIYLITNLNRDDEVVTIGGVSKKPVSIRRVD